MPKPDRPPDVLMSLEGWDDLTEAERDERIEQFLTALRHSQAGTTSGDAEAEPDTEHEDQS
jgi:hypothetical protein